MQTHEVSVMGAMTVLCLVTFFELSEAARGGGRSGGSRGGYSGGYRSSYSGYSGYRSSYSGYSSYRSYNSYRSPTYYGYRATATRYSRAYTGYYGYYRYYYNMYYMYRPGSAYYLNRNTNRAGSTVCNNYEANGNGTVIGEFACPMPFEPTDFTYCCGQSYAQYCCKLGNRGDLVAGIVIGSLIGVGLLVGLVVGINYCMKPSPKVNPGARVVYHTQPMPRTGAPPPYPHAQAPSQPHNQRGPQPPPYRGGPPPPQYGQPAPGYPPPAHGPPPPGFAPGITSAGQPGGPTGGQPAPYSYSSANPVSGFEPPPAQAAYHDPAYPQPPPIVS